MTAVAIVSLSSDVTAIKKKFIVSQENPQLQCGKRAADRGVIWTFNLINGAYVNLVYIKNRFNRQKNCLAWIECRRDEVSFTLVPSINSQWDFSTWDVTSQTLWYWHILFSRIILTDDPTLSFWSLNSITRGEKLMLHKRHTSLKMVFAMLDKVTGAHVNHRLF